VNACKKIKPLDDQSIPTDLAKVPDEENTLLDAKVA